ncbi:MAG: substrate-binding domain-containing protein, partial [Selenomonadaceae bacterium]|nr:substrate-binding domain-containing protein [Selenomonadaceae bacterium]
NLRIEGFREKFANTNFTVTETFYMEDNPQRIVDFVKNNPDYAAFFGSNEMTTLALGKAMKEAEAKQLIIGFDTSDAVLSLVYDGIVYAVMQQNPKLMGYKGIKIAVQALTGNYNDKNTKIDTGINVIKKDAM